MEPQIVRMYAGGPYRLFSDDRFLGAVPYCDAVRKGFAGAFVCELCQGEVRELIVARQQWVCRLCADSSYRQATDNRQTRLKATRAG